MKYVVENDLYNFEAWSGGKDTLDDLKNLCTKAELEMIEECIQDCLSEDTSDIEGMVSDTQINDMLWFERDWIASLLGYNNYDEFLKDR